MQMQEMTKSIHCLALEFALVLLFGSKLLSYIVSFHQGDEEKQRGVDPLPMMDRNRKKELPQNQVK